MNNENEKLGFLKEVQKMLEIADEKNFSAGEVIFNEGETHPNFYIILKGEIEISKNTTEGQPKVIAQLGAGEFLGEGALSGSLKKPAAARAVTDVTALVISVNKFEKLMEKEPRTVVDFLLSVLESANKRLSETNTKLLALYEMSRIMQIYGDDLKKLAEGITEKLISLTESLDGIFMLKNPFSSEYRIIYSSSGSMTDLADKYDMGKTGIFDDKNGIFMQVNLKDLGVILLRRKSGETAYSQSEQKLLALVADQAAATIKDASEKASDKARKMLERKRFEI